MASLANAARSGFKAVHLCIVLTADTAIGGLAILLLTLAVIKSRMRIDPHINRRIALSMCHWSGYFGESKRDQSPIHRPERRRLRRAHGWPQQRQRRHRDGRSQIKVRAVYAQL